MKNSLSDIRSLSIFPFELSNSRNASLHAVFVPSFRCVVHATESIAISPIWKPIFKITKSMEEDERMYII